MGHAEVQAANRDWERFSAVDGPGIVPTPQYRDAGMLVAFDPPEHHRLRGLISAGFTPRMVARLEDHIARRADAILDEVEARGEDVVDFVTELASPLPMHVIADIVGIPEADRPAVFAAVDQSLRCLDPALGFTQEQIMAAQLEVYSYAQQLSARKRAHPEDDVWTQLTTVEIQEPDGSVSTLTEYELDAFFMILSVAGSETTRNALSQGIAALCAERDQLRLLRDRPELLPRAADEMLRWSSPVLMFGRTATCDVELGGVMIGAGERVVLWYPAANRDPQVFADPNRFDVTRNPNPHVAFGGGGAHYCLGANLAKKEVAVMTGALLRRFPELEVAGEPLWHGAGPAHNVGVSLEALPVRLGPAATARPAG
jgi:cytochrome P450